MAVGRLTCHHPLVGFRQFFRLRRQPVARIDPNPLRSPEDATELGLIIGATGNEGTPWTAVAIKNLKDRRIASGVNDEEPASVHDAGKSAGQRAGRPPHEAKPR